MGICRLCLKEKVLLKKSHIIPDFMYQDLYDGKHKLHVFNPYDVARGVNKTKSPSSGEYQGGLLCKDCDGGIIGSLETYASKAIYGGALPANECPQCENFIQPDGLRFAVCNNIDYKKFKLFLLSVLWRASISTRPLFSSINLGPHEEEIRTMIFENNPKTQSDYPIFFMTYLKDKDAPLDLIAHPQPRRTKEGLKVHIFIIGGIIYHFYVNSSMHPLPSHILNTTITPANRMHLYHIPPGKGWELLMGFYGMKKPTINSELQTH